MENKNEPVAVYNVRRHTPSATGNKGCGTIFFAAAILLVILFVFALINKIDPILKKALMYFLISAVLALIGFLIFLYTNVSWSGTLKFYNDRIEYRLNNGREQFTILPGQLSKIVLVNNGIIKIVFGRTTLPLDTRQAREIADKLNEFIAAHPYPVYTAYPVNAMPAPAPVQAPAAPPARLNPEEIRGYRKLVEDGVITDEQFNKIISNQ
ncbi:MAG: hypothetical protein IKH82_06465 [Clostridiales bacterium]|nr:hypothetical protein [Clostridiales bacterium]